MILDDGFLHPQPLKECSGNSFPGTSPRTLFSPSTSRRATSTSSFFLLPNGGPRTASRLGCSFGHIGTGSLLSKRLGKLFHSGDSTGHRYSEGLKRRARGGLWWKRWQRSLRGKRRPPRRRRASSQSSNSQGRSRTPLCPWSGRRKLDGGPVSRSRDSDR